MTAYQTRQRPAAVQGATAALTYCKLNKQVLEPLGAAGFSLLYERLNDRDILIDRQEPPVVLRMPLAAEIAKGGSV